VFLTPSTGLRPDGGRDRRRTESTGVLPGLVLAVLTFDGVLSAVGCALLLQIHLGPMPFPVSALVSGAVNAALVWAAGQWTDSPRLAAMPLVAWLVTVAALAVGGPGGDIVFGGPGMMAFSVLIFLFVGALPAALVLRRMP